MHKLTANASKDGDLGSMYINERGRIVLARLSFRYCLKRRIVDTIQNSEAHPKVTYFGNQMTSYIPRSDSIKNWNSLLCRTKLDKSHLMQIYEALYRFIGDECTLVYGPEFCPYGPGSVSTRTALSFPMDSLVIGRILVSEPIKQAVKWRLYNNGHSTPFPMCRCG